MTTEIAAIAAGLSAAQRIVVDEPFGAHSRLLSLLSDRWIKGTGFVHASVVRDIVEAGFADKRVVRGERFIRLSAFGAQVRRHLEQADG